MGYRYPRYRLGEVSPVRKHGDPEQHLQEWYALWLRTRGILHCASVGGRRCSMGTAIKMKRSGYVRGYPDMIIEEPRGGWHGMRIELKYKNYPDQDQKTWRDELLKRGIYAVIMPGNLEYREAQDWLVDITNRYMNGEDLHSNSGKEKAECKVIIK